MQLVQANGSHYAAANVLLNSPGHTHYGFQRLHAMGRLDASAEYAASLPWFQELFTQDQLYEARTRLITHEFDLDAALTRAAANPPEWLPDVEALEDEEELQATSSRDWASWPFCCGRVRPPEKITFPFLQGAAGQLSLLSMVRQACVKYSLQTPQMPSADRSGKPRMPEGSGQQSRCLVGHPGCH